MTLHISFVSNRFVLHISDRLISRPTSFGQVSVDPNANKSIVFLARDAYVSIGYTGRASLEGRPTDQWIAEKLSNEDFSTWLPSPTGGIGSKVTLGRVPPWPDIGTAMIKLRASLVASARLLPARERWCLPRIVLCGWQRGKKLWRPILYVIADTGAGDFYQGLGWSRRHGWLQGMFYLDFTPSNPHINRIRLEVESNLRESKSIDQTESLLIDALRLASDHGVGIGKDVLSVVLRQPAERLISSRYEYFEEVLIQVQGIYASYFGPVGFTPWIVAAQYLSGPEVVIGSPEISGPLGEFTFRFESPPNLSGHGPVMSIGGGVRGSLSPSPSYFNLAKS